MTAKRLRVLLVETSDTDAQETLAKLSSSGYTLDHHRVASASAMQSALSDATFDVVLCSDDPDGFGGLEAFRLLQQLELDIPFLLLARDLREETIIRTMQDGADDYILKGSLNRLIPSIEHNLREARIRAEHRVAQLELIENQTRMHAFIADLPGMAYQILLHKDGRVSFPYVSEGCQALLGLEPQELIADTQLFEAMLHPDDRAGHQQSMHTSAQNLTFWNWEGRILTMPNNEIKWVNLRCSPRQTFEGVQWEGIMLNITQSKTAEAELNRSQEQLRELSSHIQDVREQERIAIAREVHDDLGSLLTATKLDIAWLIGRLKEQPELAAKAKMIEELVDKCVRSASTISRNLRPSALDTFGLVAAIENEAYEFAQRTGVTCTFDNMDEGITVSPHIAITLFRIFQEALANITKHAAASKVSISVINKAECVDLVVHDNGRGIRDADRAKPRSFGLRGIFERVAHFGGDVKLESAPGKGTTLSVCIPHQSTSNTAPSLSPESQQALFE
ncbi:MAG: PAS/PAC sensor signal transduction histidine kinase [Gallionellaceae bacterium]|nr:MAG: PAS/PAC sensor signal transduction histidine kinase [Gallionellaceae bacterium]